MNHEDLKSRLEKEFPGITLKLIRKSLLIEKPEDLPRVARFLKENDDFRMDYLSSVTGSDFLTYLETIYHLYSMEKKIGPVVLRFRSDREDPHAPSLTEIYRGAEFQEREAYDMYGIVYDGHPDLRRLFMWEGFEGWPMRKDYDQEDSETLESDDIAWLEKHGVPVSDQDRKKAEELRREGKRAIAQKPGEDT